MTDNETPLPSGPTCETVQANLSALQDGELDADAAARCAAHLQTCSACRTAQSEIAAVEHLAASAWYSDNMDAAADANVWGAIRREVEHDAEQADLRSLRDEVRRLRAEMQALRADVASLRAAAAAQSVPAANAVPASSRLLFPYARPDDAPRPLV